MPVVNSASRTNDRFQTAGQNEMNFTTRYGVYDDVERQLPVGGAWQEAAAPDGASADVRARQQREAFEDDCPIMTSAFPDRESERSAGTPSDTEVASPVAASDHFHLSIGTTLSDIGRVIDLLEEAFAARQVPLPLVHVAQTVADELVTNVIRHGCRDDWPNVIDVTVTVQADRLTLQLSDEGIPFDPFSRPAPELNRPLEERPAGGLGIPLVRRLAAECHYARVDGRNQVTVVLKHPAP